MMAIRKCMECGNGVSTKAESCPKCGAVLKKNTGCCLAYIALGILVLFALCVFGSLVVLVVIGSLVDDGSGGFNKTPSNFIKTTRARVLSSEPVSFISPGNGKRMQQVHVTWENTGTTPIRVVDADIISRDSVGNILERHNYTIYAEFDHSPGVRPGEIYTTPAGEGFILSGYRGLPGYTEAQTVDVRITNVLEKSGM